MKPLQRTLAIIATVCFLAQTVRHVYFYCFEPRTSVLDKYDQPLKDEIAAAASLDELLKRYEPARKETDRIKAERKATDPNWTTYDEGESEPFKTESQLHEAITSWEERAKEIGALRFYWFIGLGFAATGLLAYKRGQEWPGITLMIAGFSEFLYWTSPTFFGTDTREFDRLLLNKILFSLASLAILAVTAHLIGAFKPTKTEANPLA